MHRSECTPFTGNIPTIFLPSAKEVVSQTVVGATAASFGIRARPGNVLWVSVIAPTGATANAQGGIVGSFQFRSGTIQLGIAAGTWRFVIPNEEMTDFLAVAAQAVPAPESIVSVWLEGDITHPSVR